MIIGGGRFAVEMKKRGKNRTKLLKTLDKMEVVG